MSKELVDAVRGMIRRVTLRNIKDDAATQTASIEVADGVWRDDVEIHQPFGFASNPPEDGALGIAIAIGSDQGDITLLPLGNPSKRMGKLPKGAVGIYNEHGDKVMILPGGGVVVQAASSFKAEAGGGTLELNGSGLFHNGVNIGFDHRHKDTTPGTGNSGQPL